MGYYYGADMNYVATELYNLIASMINGSVSLVLGGAAYVLLSWGLFSIAVRRQLKNPWLAWVPIGNMWILGTISDQYQYVTTGRVRNRRKLLLGLYIAVYAILVIVMAVFAVMLTKTIISLPDIQHMSQGQILELLFGPMLTALWFLLIALVVAVVFTVFCYIALNDLYQSCEPSKRKLFLILSIFLPNVMSLFVFLCRNKDKGMPPRRDEIVPQLPAQEPPAQDQQI